MIVFGRVSGQFFVEFGVLHLSFRFFILSKEVGCVNGLFQPSVMCTNSWLLSLVSSWWGEVHAVAGVP